jgi:dihydrofolate reductase
MSAGSMSLDRRAGLRDGKVLDDRRFEQIMSDVLWHTQMSLDGFIAGPGDAMEWAFEDWSDADEPDETIAEVVRSTGALLVGRRTQDVEDREQPGFYGGAYRGPFFTLRHNPPAEPPVVKGVTGQFIDVEIEDAVKIAKGAAGGANVVILGATVAKQALEAELMDEVLVHLTPVLLGDGVRLFSRSGGSPIRLVRTSVQQTGQLTALRFRVRKDGSR